jgi:hypothetical protein
MKFGKEGGGGKTVPKATVHEYVRTTAESLPVGTIIDRKNSSSVLGVYIEKMYIYEG